MVDAGANARACVQTQGACSDVLVGVVGRSDCVCIQDGARCGRDADFAVCEFDVAYGNVGGSQEARCGCGTRAQEHAGSTLRDRACAGHHVDAAAACCCAGGADVGRAGEGHAACSQHTDVAAATDDVSVGGDVSVCSQRLNQDVARAIGTDGCVVCRCAAVVQGDRARCGAQHDVAVATGGANVALAGGLGCKGCGAVDTLHSHRDGINGHAIGLCDVHATGPGRCRQGGHYGFKVVGAGANSTAGSRTHGQASRCDIHICIGIRIAVEDADTGHQANVATGAAGGYGL